MYIRKKGAWLSSAHHHHRRRVDEQQVTSEIALMITAPVASSLFTQCDHFLWNVPRFKNAQNIDTTHCIEVNIYIVEGMCETLIMFKNLLVGTKLNLCQNKKTEWKHRENRLHWGLKNLRSTYCKIMVEGKVEAPDAGNTFRRSSCKNRPGLTTCPNHFQPMTPRFHTAHFTLLSQEDTRAFVLQNCLLSDQEQACSRFTWLFVWPFFSFDTMPTLPCRQEYGCWLH